MALPSPSYDFCVICAEIRSCQTPLSPVLRSACLPDSPRPALGESNALARTHAYTPKPKLLPALTHVTAALALRECEPVRFFSRLAHGPWLLRPATPLAPRRRPDQSPPPRGATPKPTDGSVCVCGRAGVHSAGGDVPEESHGEQQARPATSIRAERAQIGRTHTHGHRCISFSRHPPHPHLCPCQTTRMVCV